jgi:hypothetical protein
MFIRDEEQQMVQASTPVEQTRLRRWAVRRSRQLALAVMVLLATLVIGACGVLIRRATCLIGLPDVGEPFDVAFFRNFRIAEDQDAFALFRQATAKLHVMTDLPMAARRAGSTVAWSKSDPKVREWLEASREPLNLFRQGAERADGMPRFLVNPNRRTIDDLHVGQFVWLAMLEASRLEEQGDMAAAWGWYRVVLRTRAHISHRGIVFERFIVNRMCTVLEPRIAAWAGDRRTDAPLLRRALDDVRAAKPTAEWDSFSLKLDYLRTMHELQRPDAWVQHGAEEDRSIRIADEPLPPAVVLSIYAARRFILNEPERSRRVLRLAFANWLAHCSETRPANRRPAVRATFGLDQRNSSMFFYSVAPDGPAGARSLAPQDLASWLISTRDAKVLLMQWAWPSIRITERREHSALVVLLAQELYRRERGSVPPSEDALVGPYLDHLPDDGSSELDDGTAQRVDDTTIPGIGKG